LEKDVRRRGASSNTRLQGRANVTRVCKKVGGDSRDPEGKTIAAFGGGGGT